MKREKLHDTKLVNVYVVLLKQYVIINKNGMKINVNASVKKI